MSKPLRVLHYTPFFDLSGANRSMSSLLASAAKRGPTAVCVPIEGGLADHIRSTNVHVYSSFKSQQLSRWRLKRIPGNFLGLFRAVRHFRPDLIHCHSALGNHYSKWVKKITKIPLVTHQRDNYANDYFHSDLAAADGIVAISKWVFSNLPEELQRRSLTILNPVALPTDEIPNVRKSGPVRIGMAGRCVPEKGFDIAVKALLPLFEKYDFELHFWGVQNDDYGTKLIRSLEAWKDRVNIEPFRNDIDVFYRSMDVVVVPSRYPEPMGRMAVEAMAWGKAVVAAGHGGLVELIEHQQTGLLFEPGSSEDLTEKLQEMLSDTELRSRLGSQGRTWVAKTLDPDRYAAKIEEFYREILANCGIH